MKLSWEAHSCSDSQEIPQTLCKMRVHYRVNNSTPIFPITSHNIPVHTFISYFFTIRFLIWTPPNTPIIIFIIQVISLLHFFRPQLCMHFSIPTHDTCTVHPSNIWWEAEVSHYAVYSILLLLSSHGILVTIPVQCILFHYLTILNYLVNPQAPQKLILPSDGAYLTSTKLSWNFYFFWIKKNSWMGLVPIDVSFISRCIHLCKQSNRQATRN